MEGKKPKWKAQFNTQRGDKPAKIFWKTKQTNKDWAKQHQATDWKLIDCTKQQNR